MGESARFITRGFPCKIGPLCEACYNRESFGVANTPLMMLIHSR